MTAAPGQHPVPTGDRALVVAIAVNILLTAVQVVGGVLSGSLSLIADAAHNLSDAAAIAVALIAQRIGRQPADLDHTYGHGRAELIGAFVNLTWLMLLGLFLVSEGIQRLIAPQDVDGWTVVAVAGVALVVDFATAALTWRRRGHSLNIRAVFVNNAADAAGSLGVIVAGVLILLYGWHLADTIATFGIAAYLLIQGAVMLPRTIDILMQRVPTDLDVTAVAADLATLDGVLDVHDMHIWEIDERQRSLEAHVVVATRDVDRMEAVKQALKRRLADAFDITHSTLEFEFDGETDGSATPPLGESRGTP
jgi:cobalt-zinc-cadmium efflux system protein